MKKIMIALIALGMGIAANAASVNWSITTAKANVGYDVYITTTASIASMDDISNNLLGNEGNTGVTALPTATSRNAGASGAIQGLDAETSYEFYYVFVNENKQFWVSDKQTVTTGAETAAAATASLSATNSNALLNSSASGTLSENVPEPTSGLLLLLGVAGLALRRKQK